MPERSRLISVVMPTYNAAAYVREAGESILGQTHSDLELVAVDDGSADETVQILEALAAQDPRMRIIRKPTNSGVADSLNIGFAAARGRYLARMDADDISLPQRLERQLEYLDIHRATGAVGCWIGLFRPPDTRIHTHWYLAEDHATIRSQLIFNCSMQHNSCLFRRELYDGGLLTYDTRYERGEDFEFWVRLSTKTQLANVPLVLYHLRLHPNQVGQAHRAEMAAVGRRIRHEQIQALGLAPTEAEMEIHLALSRTETTASREFLDAAEAWLLRLRAANAGRSYPEPEFTALLAQRWYTACRRSTRLGPWVWGRYRESVLGDAYRPSRAADLRFLASSVVGGRPTLARHD